MVGNHYPENMITESFLHFIWKYRLFDSEYFNYKNEKIEVIDTGQHNVSSGPDFFNAKIKIGQTLWAGNVEIHVRASDWYKHNHQDDPAYDNIILHVVYEPDIAVFRRNGEEIPFVRLGFHPNLLKRHKILITRKKDPECYRVFSRMDGILYQDWIGKLGLSRMERRVRYIQQTLQENQYDWDQTFYQILGSAFGSNQNSEPFRLLTGSVPLNFIYRHRFDPLVLNAAFFGQAGFLDEAITDDRYYSQLQREFKVINNNLPEPLPGKHIWKLMRSRPASFPIVRIPQFIGLVKNTFPFMERMLETKNADEMAFFFRESVKNYWTDHFLYGISGRRPQYMPSLSTCRLWVLNAVIPVLFCYGWSRNKSEICDRAMNLLEQLPPENNVILKKWNTFGIIAKNAFDSQSLIELKTRYCESNRCTECMVGHKILKNAVTEG